MNNDVTPKTNEVISQPKSKRKKIIIILGVALVVLAASIFTYVNLQNRKLVNSYENKIYPGTFVFDKDVSNMTKSELHTVIEEMVRGISSKKINIALGENSFEKSYTDFDTTIDYEAFENEVVNFGKDKSFRDQLRLIKEPESRTYEFEMKYNEEKLEGFLDTIAEQVNISAQNASISVNGGAVNVTPGQIGYELNKDALASDIKAVLEDTNSANLVSIDGQLSEVNPVITAEALQSVDKMISS